MKKYFVFSDVHGCMAELSTALANAKFDINNPDHMLLGLGDYFDRGAESKEVYEFLNSLKKVNRGFYLMGNHDEFLWAYLNESSDGLFDFENNGMWETVKSFTDIQSGKEKAYVLGEIIRDIINKQYGLKRWLNELPRVFILDNYVFTHAGLKYDPTTDCWFADVWAKSNSFVKKFVNKRSDKIYVFGHWHAFRLTGQFYNNHKSDVWTNEELDALTPEDFKTFTYKNFIGLDGCTNYSGVVNILVIESDSTPQQFNKYSVESLGVADDKHVN